MPAPAKKLIGTIREILRTWHHVSYDELPESWRLTLLAAAETASRTKPVDINWSVEECFVGLRDCGLSRVVTETVAYYFPGTVLSCDDFDGLLQVAREADAKGLGVRALIEEAHRRKVEATKLEA